MSQEVEIDVGEDRDLTQQHHHGEHGEYGGQGEEVGFFHLGVPTPRERIKEPAQDASSLLPQRGPDALLDAVFVLQQVLNEEGLVTYHVPFGECAIILRTQTFSLTVHVSQLRHSQGAYLLLHSVVHVNNDLSFGQLNNFKGNL